MYCVTTFPPWGWDVYAHKCIQTWVKSWPGSVLAFYEGKAPPALIPGVEFRPLDENRDREEFLKIAVPKTTSFLHDVKRFCHKVFAQLSVMDEFEQFWWLDADVEIKETPPDELLQDILNRSFVSFLGRDTYTETGVIAFNQMDEDFPEFRKRYRDCYMEGRVFELPYWTDCQAFDYARKGRGYNLTPDGRGVENVLRTSPLGRYMEHHKGRLKLNLEERCD